MFKSYKGFTLVELAIVIVIIGIIMGGILGAQSLIDSSKIRGVITEIKNMETAVRAFELEYNALPGDMRDAYDYFGDDCGADTTDSRSGCNGDGDRCLAGWHNICASSIGILAGDKRRLFVHLALSEILIAPYFTSTTTLQNKDCVLGSTLVKSANGDTFYGYSTEYGRISTIYANTFYSDNGGSICRVSGGKIYHPSYVKKIDDKIDDGNALLGNITALTNDNDCANTTTGVYRVDSTKNDCFMRVAIY